jgi:two-component system, LytTR family, response regulator
MEIKNLPQVSSANYNISIKIVNLLGNQYLSFPDQSKFIRVLLKDIVRLEGVRNYTLIHLKNGDILLSSRTLKIFQNVLSEVGFVRVHRAHLINLHCINHYDESECTFAVMQNKDYIAISRRKRKDFQDKVALQG